jgi:hypothetical protein
MGKLGLKKKPVGKSFFNFFIGFEPKTFITLTLLPELVISNSL